MRDARLPEAQPPFVANIANAASASAILHPFLRPVAAATNFATNVGSGANSVRFQAKLLISGAAFQGLATLSVASATQNTNGLTVTAGTRMGLTFPAAGAYSVQILADATGLVDVTIAFAAGTAIAAVLEYGPYQIVVPAITLN